MNNSEIMGNRLIYLRELYNKKQKNVAKDLGISASTLNKWEHNKENIKFERIIQLNNYYKTNLDFLFGITNNYKEIQALVNLKVIANNLKILRKEKGLTQKQLAKLLHTSQGAYSHYETANNIIKTEYIFEFTKIFENFSVIKLLK